MRICADVELAVRLVRLPIELDVTPSGLVYGYSPKKQAAGSSDMLVIVWESTRRHSPPEERSFNIHRPKNRKLRY
jgi:hypothetical protein